MGDGAGELGQGQVQTPRGGNRAAGSAAGQSLSLSGFSTCVQEAMPQDLQQVGLRGAARHQRRVQPRRRQSRRIRDLHGVSMVTQ